MTSSFESLKRLLLFMGSFFVSVATMSFIGFYTKHAETVAVRNDILAVRQSQPSDSLDAPAHLRVAQDFTANLPVQWQTQPVLDEIRRESLQAQVAFVSVEIQSVAAPVDQLGRSNVNVSLRGTYPSLKRVLIDVLDRFPGTTATRVSLHRNPQNAGVDASFGLAVWGRQTALGSLSGASAIKALR